MSETIRFDDSLPAFASLVKERWGSECLACNLFFRDASGKLTFVVLDNSHTTEERVSLAQATANRLGAYADSSGFAAATPDELFDDRLKDLSRALEIHLDHRLFTGTVRLIDRRMVGADWLRLPEATAASPARLVFASLKGGVGRSTALCVLAARLASKGRRVLTLDMDLEAPGLGNLLLDEKTLPEYGLLDFLVESEVGSNGDDDFLADMVASSWLGNGHGRVDVVPAIGLSSLRNPANVLAKIARAYLSGTNNAGDPIGFSDHLRNLIERLGKPTKYDAVLIDARAGLHETTGAAVLGLGAEVFFFGLDQPQTFAGYELLFAHLATLKPLSGDSWKSHLRFVHSKAPRDSRARTSFAGKIDDLLRRHLWRTHHLEQVSSDPRDLRDTFDVEWEEEAVSGEGVGIETDDDQPPSLLTIFDDDIFRSFDPISKPDLLSNTHYEVSFGEFLEAAEAVVEDIDPR